MEKILIKHGQGIRGIVYDRVDLMHDDVTRLEGSMGVVVTLKSKMAASYASSGGNSNNSFI